MVTALKPTITVYVRSVKVPMGDKLVERLYPIKRGYSAMFRDGFYEVKRKMMYGYVLPDEQSLVVEDIARLSKKYGVGLKIVDVSKEDTLDPAIALQKVWRRLKGIKRFPTVESNHGERLTAPLSQSELEKLISKSAPSR